MSWRRIRAAMRSGVSSGSCSTSTLKNRLVRLIALFQHAPFNHNGHIIFAMIRARAAWALLFPGLIVYGQTSPDYTRDVQPLLEKRCYMCHGPQQQMSGLRLDQQASAARVIEPGHAAQSRLIQMVSGTEKKVMPPVGERLTTAQIAMLRAWIDAGAKWPASAAAPAVHWSFRKIQRRKSLPSATAPGRATPSTISCSPNSTPRASARRPKPARQRCCAASAWI